MKKILISIVVFILLLLLCCCSDTNVNEQSETLQENIPLEEDNIQVNTPEISDDENTDGIEDETIDAEDITHLFEVPGDFDVTLYYPDCDFLYLHAETRAITVAEGQNLLSLVVDELFAGPESSELAIALTGEDLINSVTVSSDGICTIDFKGDFAVLNTGGTTGEAFAIGSIVNSLCELDGIEQVKINIDGNDKAQFGGHNTLDAPMSFQTDLIKI